MSQPDSNRRDRRERKSPGGRQIPNRMSTNRSPIVLSLNSSNRPTHGTTYSSPNTTSQYKSNTIANSKSNTVTYASTHASTYTCSCCAFVYYAAPSSAAHSRPNTITDDAAHPSTHPISCCATDSSSCRFFYNQFTYQSGWKRKGQRRSQGQRNQEQRRI